MEKCGIDNRPEVDSPNKSRWVSAMTLGDMFDQTAESFCGDAIAFPDERITYPELSELTNRYAKALMGLGVGRQDKVGILIPVAIDYIALLLATFKIGAVAVPINNRFKEREIRQAVNKSEIKVMFISSDTREFTNYAELVLDSFPDIANQAGGPYNIADAPKLSHVICMSGITPGGCLTKDKFLQAAEPVSDSDLQQRRDGVRVRDTALFVFTSGTTSSPKPAMMTHEALYREAITLRDTRWFMTSCDRIWTVLPLFHVGGINHFLTSFTAGATFCHPGLFRPDVTLRQLSAEKCTIAMAGFETIWLQVLQHPEFPKTDLSALRIVQCAGIPEQLLRMQKMLPYAPIISCFGSTESTFALTMSQPSDPLEVRMTTCGFPLRGTELRIIDPVTGFDLGLGNRGEILYRGPMLFSGYYQEPELTKQAIDADGWFHSGDLCEWDKDGRISFKGRLKDMLKVGGENVASIEIEDFLMNHQAVQIVQVVAAPDARYDEVPAAYVLLKEGATVTEDELINFCLGQIATFKVPRYVRFVTEWPMSGTKIQKYVLRERIASELKQQGIIEAPKLQSKSVRP